MYHNSCHRSASHCLSVTKSTFCGGFKAKSKTGVRLFTLQFPARTCAHAQVCLLIPVLDKQSHAKSTESNEVEGVCSHLENQEE